MQSLNLFTQFILHSLKSKTYPFPESLSPSLIQYNISKDVIENIRKINSYTKLFPDFITLNKLQNKKWLTENNYQFHYKMINTDSTDKEFNNAVTVVEKKLVLLI